jgi:Serine/threonine protein kinase
MSTGSHDFQIPDVLDERYTNYERMAAGGMGVVYKAYDNRLDKPVAIKTMLIDQMTPDMILRFQQEARAASRLNHPNLITVLDFGMTQKNKPFLVMEFVEGDSLEARLNTGEPLPLDEAVWILCQICDGMSHAHKTGVVHRDLKPSNVMLLRNCRPEDPNVRIVDFGIAKVKGLFNSDGGVTKTGAMLGSPYYVSPEQINNSDVDPRADVYSVGCIMYRMFAGHPPFEGETYIETITAHLHQPVPKLPDSLDIPNKLKAVIYRCLSKSPDGRPETMDALSDELNTICGESDEILASGRFQLPSFDAKQQAPPTRPGLSQKRKVIAGSIAALLLLVGAASIAALIDKQSTRTNQNKVSKRKLDESKFTVEDKGDVIRATVLSDDSDLEQLRGSKVQVLELTNATDATVRKIRDLKLAYLRKLDLERTKITDACVDDLNAMTKLTDIRVPSTKITDAFAKKLRLPLRVLDLDACINVTDESFFAISANIPSLGVVEASSTKITIKGIKALRKLTRLKSLFLSNLVIDDDVIDTLKMMPRLSQLYLTEATMPKKILKRLPEIKTLRHVELSHVPTADPEMVEWLKAQMPRCEFRSQQNDAGEQMGDMSNFVDALGQ